MADPGLFDAAPFTVELPAPEPLSADRRRTIRQAEALDHRTHPLSLALGWHIPLHQQAAPADPRDAPGRRCGNCRLRDQVRYARTYAKCVQGWDGDPQHAPPRVTHGPGTDVRAWWPACRDHEYGDPDLSPDAARWVPDEAEVPA
jgi:hypothetical protein